MPAGKAVLSVHLSTLELVGDWQKPTYYPYALFQEPSLANTDLGFRIA
jgi:hypothetical protein